VWTRSSAIGARIEAPKRAGCGEGVVPTPQKICLLLALKMVNVGAYWVVFYS